MNEQTFLDFVDFGVCSSLVPALFSFAFSATFGFSINGVLDKLSIYHLSLLA
jgi:hypothetical protein